MTETKEQKEEVEQLEKEAEAARLAGVEDGEYKAEDEDPSFK